jgi:hypothetical protein
MEPKTTIKIIGNSNENTIDVGLLSIANKLNLEIIKADLACVPALILQIY